jgi:tRNA(Ile2) C34 agmatinyltransferase TiaS
MLELIFRFSTVRPGKRFLLKHSLYPGLMNLINMNKSRLRLHKMFINTICPNCNKEMYVKIGKDDMCKYWCKKCKHNIWQAPFKVYEI